MATATLETDTAKSTTQYIPIDQITPSRHQARKDFDEAGLQGLAESMKQEGLLEPVVVRLVSSAQYAAGSDDNTMSADCELQTAHYQLIFGERRLRAARLLGWQTIEAKIVQPVNEASAAAKGLVENLQRQDLNPIEEAEGFQTLNQLDPGYWTQEQIGKVAGKSQTYVSRSTGLLSLPVEIKGNMRRRIISRDHGIELLRLSDSAKQSQVAKEIISKDLSRGETRKLVDGMVGNNGSSQQSALSSKTVTPAKAGVQPSNKPFTFKLEGDQIVGSFRIPRTANLDQELAKLRGYLLAWLAAHPYSVSSTQQAASSDSKTGTADCELQSAHSEATNDPFHLDKLDPDMRAKVEAALHKGGVS